jgi:hypothetical protein
VEAWAVGIEAEREDRENNVKKAIALGSTRKQEALEEDSA